MDQNKETRHLHFPYLHIVMVGTFPPPSHGMAAVNLAVKNQFKSIGVNPLVIDVSAAVVGIRLKIRLSRLNTVIRAICWLAHIQRVRGAKFYMSISGGLGQIYETIFSFIARFKGMKLFLHHHSFSYINTPKIYTRFLIKVAGESCVHIALSKGMANRLRKKYKINKILFISNAVFSIRKENSRKKPIKKLRTIGYISNISFEKGILEFFNLMETISSRNLQLKGLLAGPVQSSNVKKFIMKKLKQTPDVKYIGPVYGDDKENFFSNIDVLVLPTQYENEAEPLVLHEAMSNGIPTIAYGRGCIPEIISEDSGKVINPDENFVQEAFEQILDWYRYPEKFETACMNAKDQFYRTYFANLPRKRELLIQMTAN